MSDEGSPRLGAGSPSRLPLKQSSFKSSQKIFSSITSTASPSSSSSVGSNGSSAGGDQSAFFGVPLELLMARGGAVRYMEVPKLILNMTSYIIANLPKVTTTTTNRIRRTEQQKKKKKKNKGSNAVCFRDGWRCVVCGIERYRTDPIRRTSRSTNHRLIPFFISLLIAVAFL